MMTPHNQALLHCDVKQHHSHHPLTMHTASSTTGTLYFIFILLIAAGVEPNPGPCGQDQQCVVQTASYHQGDTAVFSSMSVGRQCVANSVVAVTMSKFIDVHSWTTNDMDHILHQGDALYRRINPRHHLLEIEDIPCSFELCGQKWCITTRSETHTVIGQEAITNCLKESADISNDAIVMLGDHHGASAFSIMKTRTSSYIFEPHSRSKETAMPAHGGTAVVVKFSSDRELADYVFRIAQTIHAKQMSVWTLDVSPDDQLSCPKCDRMFRRLHNLKQHYASCGRKCQKQCKDFVCHMCGREFDNQYNVDTHSMKCKSTQAKEENTLTCEHCPRLFKNRHNLDEHMLNCPRKIEQIQEDHMCTQCLRTFDNRYNLFQHTKRCVSAEKEKRIAQEQSGSRCRQPMTDSQRKRRHRAKPGTREVERLQDSMYKHAKRQDPHQKQKERQWHMDHKQLKRKDPEFIAAERVADQVRKQQCRADVTQQQHIRRQNRQQMQNSRTDSTYLLRERAHDCKRKQVKRNNAEFRQLEAEIAQMRMQKRRSQPDTAEQERVRNRHWKQQHRQDMDYAQHEFSRKKLSKLGQSLAEAVQIFVNITKEGPIYVCTSCHQTMFCDDVDDVSSLRPRTHKDMLQMCCTQYVSIDNKEWLCHVCKASIYQGEFPKMSVANKVGFPVRPPELELHPLEETLISPLLPFMRVRSLPIGGLVAEGQKLIIGNVVHVPNDIASTVQVLPRQLDDMGTIAVKLKRKKCYKTSVFQENIRPAKVIAALHYLKTHSSMYARVMADDTWECNLSTSNSDNRYFLEDQAAPMDNVPADMTGDESADTFEEVPASDLTHGNMDTLLDEAIPVQVYNDASEEATRLERTQLTDDGNNVTVLAPGEGQIPVFRDLQAEYKCFPTIFCGQERPEPSERHRPVSVSLLFKAELRHVDPRVCLNIPNIFWKAKHLQIKQVVSKVNLALRRLVGAKHNKVTARDLLDPDKRDTIRRLNEGYRIFRDIRNSPPYFEQKKKELNAMIRQLGYPVLFFSLSSADTYWPDLIRCLGILVDKTEYSTDYIETEMTFAKKCQLVAAHPAACSRFFHHRVEKYMRLIIAGEHSPFGKVSDYFYRVEYQKRGSPHIHGFLWVHDAPDIRTASAIEICKYVDSCISCSSDVPESHKPYLKLQLHSHNKTCKRLRKDKPTCRFGAPWPPMQQTVILDPLQEGTDEEIQALKVKYNDIMNCTKSLPPDVETFQDWLEHIDLTEEKYLQVIRSSIERRKLFLKRQPNETRVNAYMKNLLGGWRANHDIQFVLNCFQCVSYICDYMTKSQKGISDTMHCANAEANDGNMDLKASVRHIGGKFLNAAESPVQQCCADILQLPATNSTRKKEFINTNPPELRVGLAKSLKTLEEMKPDSKEVTMMGNIDKYAIRPKALEAWCLADYVAKTDISYVNAKPSDEADTCDVPDPEQLERHEEELYYAEGDGFPFSLRSGHMLRLRTKDKVLRYRRYNRKTDPENYYREKLLLYIPWRKESLLKGNYDTFEGAYNHHKAAIHVKMETYEPVSSDLDAAYDEFYESQKAAESMERAQMTDADDPVEVHDMHVFEPDPDSPLFRVDIGPELGIAATQNEQDAVERVPIDMSDHEYYKLLRMLNTKQQEFHSHIIHRAMDSECQTLCVLHGGAGTGKSTVIRAISEGLQRLLRNQPGQDFSGQRLMLMAPTGKAAYNIKGQTVHRAFFVPASQRLEYRALKWDALNTIRSNFRGVDWVLIDEFSMVGKRMLLFIHLRLQEIRGNRLPFGGMNIILFGDLHQLQPVKDGWIFENMDGDYGALAPNLFRDYFLMFELDEIMRQKEDKTFAECLNRLRQAKHTVQDIQLLKTRKISTTQSNSMPDIPHFFTTNANKDAYNERIMEQTQGKLCEITAVDVAPLDIPKSEQQKALAAAKVKPISGAGNLSYTLAVKEGVRYDVTANIAPADGIVNGSECTVRHIAEQVADKLPLCIWVEFTNKDTGKELRKSVGCAYQQYTQKNWTPIQPIIRTFVASRNNYAISRKQFPLQMSSGRTIHKAQSATHEKIVVDMSGTERAPRTFWEHIHYVAFSRCTSLNGLHVIDINEAQIRASPKVTRYVESEKTVMNLCYTPLYIVDGLKVAFNNVGSVLRKWPAIERNQNILGADVIVFAETWLSSKNDNTTCILEGFQQCRMDSTHRIGHRGMLMFVKNSIGIKSMVFHQSEHLEVLSCQVQYKGQTVTILGVYKPPVALYTSFVKELSECLSCVATQDNIVLVGDFNVDVQNHDDHRFIQYMQNHHSLRQIVQEPSTWDGTLIDLLFTNVRIMNSYTLVNTWSKHNIVCAYGPELFNVHCPEDE